MTGFWDRLEARLARVTTSGEIIREVDGFRAIAIGMVILHHLLAVYLQNTERFGDVHVPADWMRLRQESTLVRVLFPSFLGVQLFFVISGFVLGLPFARHYLRGRPKPKLGAYFRRRLTRLEPPYILAATVLFAVGVASGKPFLELIPHYFATLFYAHSLIYGAPSLIEGVFWSLEVEVQFYVLAPILATVFAIRKVALRRCVLIGWILGWALLASRVSAITDSRAALTLAAFGQYFLAGFLFADFYLSGLERRDFLPDWRWDLISVACLAAMVAMYWTPKSWRYLWMLPFLIVLLYQSLFRGKWGAPLMRMRPVYLAGGMCYTTYLYHSGLLGAFGEQTMRLWQPALPFFADLTLQGLVLAPIVLSVCAAVYYYTEKPFMIKRWG